MSRGRPSPGTLLDRLAARVGGETVIVGMGNPYRGDDAAGCLVARTLGAAAVLRASDSSPILPCPRGSGPLRLVEAEEVPESYLGTIVHPAPDTVILVDAVDMGAPPGSVAILEVSQVLERDASTHRPPLTLLAHYIRAETGADVFVVGIQPETRELGAPTSIEVRQAAAELAGILNEAVSLVGRRTREEAATC